MGSETEPEGDWLVSLVVAFGGVMQQCQRVPAARGGGLNLRGVGEPEAESEDSYKWLGEDKSCTAGGFAGSHISCVLSENEKPNQQMKEFAVEMEQQRVCLHASWEKVERSVRQEWERVAEKMDSQQA